MSKVSLKPAVSGKNHHSYQPFSALSLDFGDLVASRVIETAGTDDDWSNISGKGIIRLAPSKFPTFGRSYINTAAFYVPESQLIHFSDALHDNMHDYKAENVIVPYFVHDTLNEAFASLQSSSLVTLVADLTDPTSSSAPARGTYHFQFVTNSSGTTHYKYFKLNAYGLAFFKIFKSVGYDFASYVNSSTYTTAKASANSPRSALNLLAYLKVYCDYFVNGHHYNSNPLVQCLQSIYESKTFTYSGNTVFDASTGLLSIYFFDLILTNFRLPYMKNMYLDAYNTPNSPTGVGPSGEMQNVNPSGQISPYITVAGNSERPYSNTSDQVLLSYNGSGSQTTTNFVSARGQRILKALDKLVRMGHLSGSRAVQRLYTRLGGKPNDASSEMVVKLYEGADRLDFAPVLSNSDTVSGSNGARLGQFAGFCACALNFNFNYQANGYGYIIVLHWISVDCGFLRGCDPSTMRLNSLDFWTPEYDGATVRPIPISEISVADDGRETTSQGDKQIFGFTNLYDDYRSMRDLFVGDFVFGSGIDWVFSRDLSYYRGYHGVIPQSLHAQDGDVQYYYGATPLIDPSLSNPFQTTRVNGDRFYLFLDYDIDANRPVKSKIDSYELYGSGDLTVNVGGNLID